MIMANSNSRTANSKGHKKYGYFLGCVMPAKMPWAEKATLMVSKHLGLDFEEMKETLCCVRPGVWKAINTDWWLTLTSQNLANAEKQGIVLVDSCNGCWISHYETLKELTEEPEKLEMVNRNLSSIGMHFSGNLKVKHFLEVLYEDVGLKKIRSNVVRPLDGFRIMRHIGCHARKHGDKLPGYFDEILRATGVEIVDTPYDKTCCGLLLYFSDPHTSIFDRIGMKMSTAKELDIDAYAIICSGCYDQFERAVKVLKEERGVGFETPIVHFSELLAIAFGYKPDDFGMKYCRPIPTTKFIEKLTSKEGNR